MRRTLINIGTIGILIGVAVIGVSMGLHLANRPRISFEKALPGIIGGGCCLSISFLSAFVGVVWMPLSPTSSSAAPVLEPTLMPNRSSGTLWLVFGLILGLIALLVLALGGFSIIQTHKNVQIHEEMVEREARELEKLKPVLHLPENRAKANDCKRIIEFGQGEVREYKFHRNIALMIACSSTLPGMLGLAFLGIFVMKRFKRAEKGLGDGKGVGTPREGGESGITFLAKPLPTGQAD